MATISIIKTAGAVGRGIIAAAVVIGYSSVAVHADTTGTDGSDPMRCEALKLKCDSRHHMCLSRCDGIADRRAVHSPEAGEEMRSNCSNACELRHHNMELRLKERPVCAGRPPVPPAPPKPEACTAKLLWVKANYMQCMGRCYARFDQRPAFDCDGCMSECYDVYHAETDGTNANPICSAGPVEPVELEAEPGACAPR